MDDNRQINETTLRVRFAETDMMGVVHHANYIIYFEAARVEFSRRAGAPYADLEAAGYSLAVSDLQIRYLGSARFDQMIVVRTWVETIRSRAVTFGYEIVDQETRNLLVTGSTQLICIDREGQVRRIPETWYKAMSQLAPHGS